MQKKKSGEATLLPHGCAYDRAAKRERKEKDFGGIFEK
jgi:hypothetical protein